MYTKRRKYCWEFLTVRLHRFFLSSVSEQQERKEGGGGARDQIEGKRRSEAVVDSRKWREIQILKLGGKFAFDVKRVGKLSFRKKG
jgi:hypothetical protein